MKQAFIIMPFDHEFERIYQDLFIPPLEEMGYRTLRADSIFNTTMVMTDIYEAIKKSSLILCDVSDKNPNVFYELGLAHAIGKPTILVTNNLESVPFDLRAFRLLVYDKFLTVAQLVEFKSKMIESIKELESSRDVWPPPLITESAEKTEQQLSFFISYSARDREFVSKLHGDLQDAGVNCWLDSKELVLGDNWAEKIQESIQREKQFLLILSVNSIESKWVKYEIQKLQEQQQKGRDFRIFPIRIDNAVFTSDDPLIADVVSHIQMADFENWKQETSYKKSFQKLVRDITVVSARQLAKGAL